VSDISIFLFPPPPMLQCRRAHICFTTVRSYSLSSGKRVPKSATPHENPTAPSSEVSYVHFYCWHRREPRGIPFLPSYRPDRTSKSSFLLPLPTDFPTTASPGEGLCKRARSLLVLLSPLFVACSDQISFSHGSYSEENLRFRSCDPSPP